MKKTFYVRPAAGERVETEVILQAESRGALLGRVLDPDGNPVEDAVVTLFAAAEGHSDRLTLTDCQYTDENGHFIMAPLVGGCLYVVKVHKNSMKLRQLELTSIDN